MPQHYMNGGPCDQSNSTVSGYNPMTNGNAQAAMNAGLSCSSVFSAGSGGSKQQHQQQSAMYSCYSNQTAYMSNIDTPPPMTLMTWVVVCQCCSYKQFGCCSNYTLRSAAGVAAYYHHYLH
uniref:Uncharacterized protein n=2 Tax=Schistocephalus solidus TaxID=70667 RepID=A0A0V0J1W0_SCHSO